jgi:hypothetical protein
VGSFNGHSSRFCNWTQMRINSYLLRVTVRHKRWRLGWKALERFWKPAGQEPEEGAPRSGLWEDGPSGSGAWSLFSLVADRLFRVARACKDYGVRVQQSVFECQVCREEWAGSAIGC